MRRLSPSALLACPFALATLSGCAAGAPDGAGRDAAEGATSAAVVVIERTVSADETVRGSIVARFLRMRNGAVDDDALRMVGATLDLPAEGTCAPQLGGSDPGATIASSEPAIPRAVELLDVGAVAIESGEARTELEARSLPDIVDLVSGVVYATRSTEPFDARTLPGHGSYQLSMGGSAELDLPPFSMSATASGEPDGLHVDGKDVRANDGIVFTIGANVDVRWDVADDRAPDDLVYIDIAPSGATSPTGATIRCQFADRGSATLPATAFDSGTVSAGTLIVHRVHREMFHVGGIDSGVLRFDFARAIPFTRR